ncbi:HlyC/CorC family transporter [Chloroflexia bacterium SDU3-3]|nr:HlyC/CorC family transporter [Chloroflexia bacterium SDU3-3]
MSEGVWVEAIIVVVLMLANGFFAASEIAVVSARKNRLEQRANEGNRGAAAALELAENPNRFLSTVQVGITVIGTFAAAFGGQSLSSALAPQLHAIPILAPYADALAFTVVVILISYLSLIIGELVPKRLALQGAEGMAQAVAPVMQMLSRLAAPVVWFLTLSADVVLRLLGRHNVAETPITEDDVIALVREGAEEGTLEASEQEFINSVFTFTDRTVRSLMTPRTQVVAIELGTPISEVVETITSSGYSRIPVYEETLDHVLGILHAKDLLRDWGQGEALDLHQKLRQPLYVLEGQRAMVAFQQLKQSRIGLAMVLDEYGQVAGVLSMEDMLEELVGELQDEYDEAEEAVVARDDGTFLVDGLLPFPEAVERLNLPDGERGRESDFETFAGFLLSLLGHIPNVGAKHVWQGFTFEVIDMDGRRIDKILVKPPTPNLAQSEAVLATGRINPSESPRKGTGD